MQGEKKKSLKGPVVLSSTGLGMGRASPSLLLLSLEAEMCTEAASAPPIKRSTLGEFLERLLTIVTSAALGLQTRTLQGFSPASQAGNGLALAALF